LERCLAQRFAPPLLRAAAGAGEPVAGDISVQIAPASPAIPLAQLVPGRVESTAASEACDPAATLETAEPSILAPHIVLRIAVSPATHAKLRYAQALLSHAVPSGDLAAVVDRALDTLIAQLERHKIAATKRPRPT